MKSTKKLLALGMAIIITSAVSVTAFAVETNFGSAAVEEKKTYTLSEMLTYAIQDEYLAYAEYEKIISSFAVQRPFTNIMKAETTHIALLEPLFTEYGIALPKNTAEDHVVVPATLLDAYKAGVEAEIKNIAMYEVFLKQNLPEDVRAVFTSLQNASEKHLTAFERGVSRLEGNTAGGAGISAGQGGNSNRWA
ncbi:hypothetical protein SDC9_180988 [bioreactor metagenome]|uniref:DUF2202 domain-containing protein n=1 Tax=bioreactor metagenome TaxID=1076179 RepID=A0A645H487_9ZZZZ|nr:hypothetical protein [Candidatus Pelethousia sp.]